MLRMLAWKKVFFQARLSFNLETKPVSWKPEVFTQRLRRLWWACVSSSDRWEREPGSFAQQWTYHAIKHWTMSQEYLHVKVRMFFPFQKKWGISRFIKVTSPLQNDHNCTNTELNFENPRLECQNKYDCWCNCLCALTKLWKSILMGSPGARQAQHLLNVISHLSPLISCHLSIVNYL